LHVVIGWIGLPYFICPSATEMLCMLPKNGMNAGPGGRPLLRCINLEETLRSRYTNATTARVRSSIEQIYLPSYSSLTSYIYSVDRNLPDAPWIAWLLYDPRIKSQRESMEMLPQGLVCRDSFGLRGVQIYALPCS
jgi:hypothetical protein